MYWWFSYACAIIHACVGSECNESSANSLFGLFIFLSEAILILRVNAMYLNNKRLLTFLSTFFACSLVGGTVFITYMLIRMRSKPSVLVPLFLLTLILTAISDTSSLSTNRMRSGESHEESLGVLHPHDGLRDDALHPHAREGPIGLHEERHGHVESHERPRARLSRRLRRDSGVDSD